MAGEGLSIGSPGGGAPLASPVFTGSPKAPTKTAGDNSTNLATTAYVDAASNLYLPWLVEGLLGWSYDNAVATGTGVAPATTGDLTVAKIPVPVSITVTNLLCRTEAAGTGITANQSFMAAWSSNGATLLGQTADQSTNWAGAAGTKEMACTVPFTVVGGRNVFIYVGILCNATGLPTFQRGPSNDGNAGRTGAGLRFGRKTTTDTSVPPSITPSGLVSAALFWMALS